MVRVGGPNPQTIRALTSADVIDVCDRAGRILGHVVVDSLALAGLSVATVNATAGGVDTEVITAPGIGHRIRVTGLMYANRATSLSPQVSLRFGNVPTLRFTGTLAASGGMINWNLTHPERPYWQGGDNEALNAYLSADGNVDITVTFYTT